MGSWHDCLVLVPCTTQFSSSVQKWHQLRRHWLHDGLCVETTKENNQDFHRWIKWNLTKCPACMTRVSLKITTVAMYWASTCTLKDRWDDSFDYSTIKQFRGGSRTSQMGEAPTPEFGVKTHYLARLLSKTAWKWMKLDRERMRILYPPMQLSFFAVHCITGGIQIEMLTGQCSIDFPGQNGTLLQRKFISKCL